MVFNNIIAMAVHTVIAIITTLIMVWINSPGSGISNCIPVILIIMFVVFSLVYVACGFFFLKPVNNAIFSVLSVFVVLILIVIYCILKYGIEIESFLPYMYCNIYASFVLKFHILGICISTIIPSILMYLGIILKVKFKNIY